MTASKAAQPMSVPAPYYTDTDGHQLGQRVNHVLKQLSLFQPGRDPPRGLGRGDRGQLWTV